MCVFLGASVVVFLLTTPQRNGALKLYLIDTTLFFSFGNIWFYVETREASNIGLVCYRSVQWSNHI